MNVYFSIALILAAGYGVNLLFKKLKLPPLIGYLIVGILIGPFGLNLIGPELYKIAPIFRGIALVVILIRAGFALDLKAFKQMGRPVILLSFLPAVLEVIIVGLTAPLIFGLPWLDAFLMGAVIASVSPAVIIPQMLKMIEERHGTEHLIPETIITGSSLDDIVVITIFTLILSIKTTGTVSTLAIVKIPVSLVAGLAGGALLGWLFYLVVKKTNMPPLLTGIIIMALCAAFYFLEDYLYIKGLLAILTFVIVFTYKIKAVEPLKAGFKGGWFVAEMMLFTLVGMGLDMNNFLGNIWRSILIIAIALSLRMIGTALCLIKSRYTRKEKIFIVAAYLPKATVQAAIGSLALEAGLESGAIILSVAIAAILITAPLGAILIDLTKDRLIAREAPPAPQEGEQLSS